MLDLAETAQLASLADETPEGRSIVVLAKEKYGLRGRTVGATESGTGMQFIPFSSQTRMSGVDFGDVHIRKGAADVMFTHIEDERQSRIRCTQKRSRDDLPCRRNTARGHKERQSVGGRSLKRHRERRD